MFMRAILKRIDTGHGGGMWRYSPRGIPGLDSPYQAILPLLLGQGEYTRPSASSLVRSIQLLVRLFGNGRNKKLPSIALCRGSMQDHASWGIEDHEKGEGISPELHGRNLLMISTQLGPQSTRKPLVTHYAVMDENPVGPPAQQGTCTGPSEGW